MTKVIIVLGEQDISCEVQLDIDKGIYSGNLLESIEDDEALRFWSAYENAVNGVMLHVVGTLEEEMEKHSFRVVVGDNEFLGADLDLQIFPSSMGVSFNIPSQRKNGSE